MLKGECAYAYLRFFPSVPFQRRVRSRRVADRCGDAHCRNRRVLSPYNIERTGEDAYRITLAVAGFAPEELNIETRENVLTVSGERKNGQEEGVTYLHRGIAGRAFERRFQLADHVEVVNADLANGLLKIELVRRVPEAMKPRKVQIGSGKGPVLEHAKKAA